jgi:ribose/xylose/arabinose/galactoside ABC-type transport system permease subunit
MKSKVSLGSIKNFIKSQGALVALLVLIVIATFRYEQFLTVLNISNVLRQVSMIGLVAIGMTFVILTGGIDLSVGSMVAVAGVLAANLSSTSIFLAIVVPLIVTAILGTINGFVVAKLKIAPFIATLAMMMGVRGIAYISTGETSVRVNKLASGFTHLARGFIFGVPIPAIIFVCAIIIAALVLKYTKFGRHVLAVGGNEDASKMMGLNVMRIKILVYTLSGTMAGFAGVILASRLGAGQPVAGEGWEMTAIASVVLGGTLLSGGVGKFSGTFIGTLIMGIITNMFNMQGNINTWWQNVIMGALLLGVVIIQSQVTKNNNKQAI